MTERPKTIENIPSVIGPHYTAFYCNNIGYAMSAIDIVLVFGEVVNTGTEVFVEQRSRVTMTPVQAKILRDMLNRQLERYENVFGAIKIPEGLAEAAQIDNEEG